MSSGRSGEAQNGKFGWAVKAAVFRRHGDRSSASPWRRVDINLSRRYILVAAANVADLGTKIESVQPCLRGRQGFRRGTFGCHVRRSRELCQIKQDGTIQKPEITACSAVKTRIWRHKPAAGARA